MAIRDLLTRKLENFMQALITLVSYKNAGQWEKALDFIRQNTDTAFWDDIGNNNLELKDKEQKESVAFQLKLRFHEVEILKKADKKYLEKAAHLSLILDKFLKANPDSYFMELEEMKLILLNYS